jgi:hypothetical protein
MKEIMDYAKGLGILSATKHKNKEDLVRTIQVAEGNYDCFKRVSDCQERSCRWFEDCL